MRKIIVTVLIMLLTACTTGVSQQQYDELLAENEMLKQKVSALETNTQFVDNDTKENEYSNNNVNLPSNDDFMYVSNGEAIQINDYLGDGGDLIIPNEIEGLPVTRIAPYAFEEAHLTSVVLPDTLEFIGDNAFYDDDSLSGGVLIIPQSVKEIGGHAFQSSGIEGLVILGDCKTNVNTFANLNNLEFIYIAENCSVEIGRSCMTYAESLTTAIIPASVKVIKDGNFNNCNFVTIYTTEESTASEYARENFINANYQDYDKMVKEFSELYK